MKCTRVWDGKWRRQQFLFLLFSDHSITLDLNPLTSETSSFKANVNGGSQAALISSDVESESLQIAM